MNAYELRIRGLGNAISFATARWVLFVFPEVQGLAGGGARNRLVVLYEGESADPTAWCRVLSAAGYPATPVGPAESGEAA